RSKIISCGESGLSLRMFAPLAALFDYDITFIGEGSILKRPVDFFDSIFPQLGVEIQSNEGKVPIKIRGPLVPKNITVDGSLSSQFLTGLLMAFARAARKPVKIKVKNLTSRPYIDLTLDVLNHFGFRVTHQDYEEFTLLPQDPQPAITIKYTVEGDWSNIAFLLVAGAISGSVAVKGAFLNSSQGDKKILEALEASGAAIKVGKDEITVSQGNLRSFYFDATNSPDLFPPLVALAAYCQGTTTIKGVKRLLHKESDRAMTLQEEFGKMHVDIHLDNDLMQIKGGHQVHGAKVTSHNDHRIAMACAVAALKAKGNTTIREAEAVNKSYPAFFEDLTKLKVHLTKS
ncbi:MAG: 3-phosphoshikimate 1-carboxyvinyltransferase, partial [Bacteroidota bacterium]|nr:3-phosphoshikimate 1-carboxyvinyltransferase [Bacteroidota bacterium]